MRNYKITPVTWLGDDEFIGTGTRTVRFYIDVATKTVGEREDIAAVYGWTKNGKSFFIYTIKDGHIQKLGTMKRDQLLDFRSVKV